MNARAASDFWFYVVVGLILIAAGWLVYLSSARAESGFRTDPLVKIIEQEQGLSPGGTRILPECGCTVRYLGTKIQGHVYMVYLDKLD